jgi:3-oxoacyl-[acyl-carrier-protein] synthase-1
VFATAERMLRLGLVDAAVVGGVDTLCGSVLFGFNALQLVSAEPCRPFDAERSGISIGEAAGFALLERADDARTLPAVAAPTGRGRPGAARRPAGLYLLGYGESSDAHHMSTPHPDGLGAERALDDALARAGIDAGAVDHINLHGTASAEERRGRGGAGRAPLPGDDARQLDQGRHRPHARRAGIVEAAASLLAIEHGLRPGTGQHARPRRRRAGRRCASRPSTRRCASR